VSGFRDVTDDDLVFRRQADRLMRLSESLTTALDEQQVAECVCPFLVDAFEGRTIVALCDHEVLAVAARVGFSDSETARLTASGAGSVDEGPINEAVRTNSMVVDPDAASLSVPLRADPTGPAVGAMHVGWTASWTITDAMTTLAETVSSLVTLALARIVATKAIQQVEFRRALEAMLDHVVIGRAVRSDDGAIVDFVIEFVNSHSANDAEVVADDLVGRLVRDIYPEWITSGIFARLCEVVETGVPYRGDRLRWAGTGLDGAGQQGYRSMQVAKFGDGYIAASRDDTEMVAAEEASREAALQEAAERTAIALLQAAALPTTLPQLPGVRIAAVYEPADPRQPVGGDWFDVFALDEQRVAVVIADVAGHGHPAAVFMLQVRNVFRAIAADHTDPGDVLNRANDVTTRLNELDGPFVTCCYAVLDIGARTLRWAQAGHFSPLVVAADGTSTYLDERPGPPLALFEGHRYESSSIEVRQGDRVVMFTDGLVERRREHLDIGLARLARLSTSYATLAPQEFVETLASLVTDRFDDLAVVCIDFVRE
jgi:hypothetical protein